ncbi:hypothetical protein CEXT_504951 [Caerostris extrusa]|uniref:Uncharacterized protein n=1 Tax=Caerostris extrusa TaxID=172846 RepID=A0AAV4PJJ3_CAEEX|nr:hypothetical protein CEXT_504951 [Caerostris extrusa]
MCIVDYLKKNTLDKLPSIECISCVNVHDYKDTCLHLNSNSSNTVEVLLTYAYLYLKFDLENKPNCLTIEASNRLSFGKSTIFEAEHKVCITKFTNCQGTCITWKHAFHPDMKELGSFGLKSGRTLCFEPCEIILVRKVSGII